MSLIIRYVCKGYMNIYRNFNILKMVLHQQADAFLHPIPFHLENDAFIFVALAVVNPHLAVIHKNQSKT